MSRLAAGERSTVTPTPEPSMLQRAGRYGQEYLQGLQTAGDQLTQARTVPGFSDVVGAGEALGTMATGAVAPIVGAVRSAVTGEPLQEATEAAIYEPRTQMGKATLGAIGAVTKPAMDLAGATGADIALLPMAAGAAGLPARQSLAFTEGMAKRGAQAAVKESQRAPSTQELGVAAKQAYQRAKDAGAVAAPEGYSRMASGLRSSLREQGFNPKLHPKAAAVIEEIEGTGAGKPVALDEIEILRRQALAAERSIEADERRVAGLIIDRLDDYADALASGAEPVMGGNAPAAVAARKEARGLYARSRKAMEIEELQERAKVRATQFSGSGEENALRTEFRQLALNKKRLGRFNEAEQQAIKEVAFGTLTSNTLRQIGKLAPTGGLSQWLGIGATMINPLAAAVPAAGVAARLGATRLTRNAAQRAEELMRRGPARKNIEAEAAEAPASAQADEIARAGEAFDAERAAAAQAARGGYEVGESASEAITLETRPQNRLRQLSPMRTAARTAVATRTQAPRTVAKIESDMRAIQSRADTLSPNSPELLELDARYVMLQEELARAKQKGTRNRVAQLSGGR